MQKLHQRKNLWNLKDLKKLKSGDKVNVDIFKWENW